MSRAVTRVSRLLLWALLGGKCFSHKFISYSSSSIEIPLLFFLIKVSYAHQGCIYLIKILF